MAPDSREIADQPTEPEALSNPWMDWYDRTSLVGDCLVRIADQSIESDRRRAPENRICEFIDGIVYLPSSARLQHQFDLFFLSFLLEGFTARRRLGHLLGGPACLSSRFFRGPRDRTT